MPGTHRVHRKIQTISRVAGDTYGTRGGGSETLGTDFSKDLRIKGLRLAQDWRRGESNPGSAPRHRSIRPGVPLALPGRGHEWTPGYLSGHQRTRNSRALPTKVPTKAAVISEGTCLAVCLHCAVRWSSLPVGTGFSRSALATDFSRWTAAAHCDCLPEPASAGLAGAFREARLKPAQRPGDRSGDRAWRPPTEVGGTPRSAAADQALAAVVPPARQGCSGSPAATSR